MPVKRAGSESYRGRTKLQSRHGLCSRSQCCAVFLRGPAGLQAPGRVQVAGRTVYIRLRAAQGDGTIALHLAEPGRAIDSPGLRLYFEVRGLEAFCKRLEAAGIVFSQQPKLMPWGWKHAYLNDPEGHEVSLYWAGAKRFRKSSTLKPKQAGTR